MSELPPAFLVAVATAFGLIVGSFGNVVIYRLPVGQSIVFPASRCPKCGASIAPWQNIPVLSWILLRGRCASCAAPIAWRYPVVEAVHGIGFGLVVFRFGVTLFTPFLLLFFFALVVLALIDWDHQILPDAITLPWTLLGLSGSLVPGSFVGIRESALSAGFGYLGFLAVAKGYERLRGIEGLGQGDWKLAAMLGAFLGGQGLLLVVFMASLSGMTYGLIQAFRLRAEAEIEPPATHLESPVPISPVPVSPLAISDDVSNLQPLAIASDAEPEASLAVPPSLGLYRLPFGTFLAASAVVVLFVGERILTWYRLQLNG